MIPIPPGLAGPLLKAGVIAALALFLYGLGQWHGRAAIQEAWDAEVMQQQVRAGEYIVKQAQLTAQADTNYHRQLQRHQADAQRLAQKVRDYERQPQVQCELSHEFERTFDAVSLMRQPAADGLPPAAEASSLPAPHDPPRLTDAAVLSAYHGAVRQLYACADQANALIEWEQAASTLATEGAGR